MREETQGHQHVQGGGSHQVSAVCIAYGESRPGRTKMQWVGETGKGK